MVELINTNCCSIICRKGELDSILWQLFGVRTRTKQVQIKVSSVGSETQPARSSYRRALLSAVTYTGVTHAMIGVAYLT